MPGELFFRHGHGRKNTCFKFKTIENFRTIKTNMVSINKGESIMKRFLAGCVFAIAMLVLTSAYAQEERCHITLHSGDLVRNAQITKMGRDILVVEASGTAEKIPVGNIAGIKFTGEPVELNNARTYLVDSRFEDMLDELKNIDSDQLTPNMKKECEFLVIRAFVGQAFSGALAITKAIDKMDDYFKSKENQEYYRFYELSELYGELNMLIGSDESLKKASSAFAMLQKAKDSPILKARGLIGFGTIANLKGDAENAEKSFKEVLQMVRNQELEGVKSEMEVKASSGLARALVLEGKGDQAIADIQKFFAANKIAQEDPLNAQLYNALGFALLKNKKPKDAAIAYMHTHLLYNGNKQLHVEALDAMIQIFRAELRDELRAGELEALKSARYGGGKKSK